MEAPVAPIIAPSKTTYVPHHPEGTLLYQVMADYLETWLADRRAECPDGKGLPRHVEKELRDFLVCGIPANGFILRKCVNGCGALKVVPYSCKHRTICPTCTGKRMNETAIHLTENVLPHVPWRQWVVTFPMALRHWLAANHDLANLVHRIVIRMITSYYVTMAKERGVNDPLPGGMTFVQRFGDGLRLHHHLHILMMEGVYSTDSSGKPIFYDVAGPTDEEVAQVLEAIAHVVTRMLRKKKYLTGEGAEEVLSTPIDKIFAESMPLAAATLASGRLRIAFGENTGNKVRRIGRGFGYEEEVPHGNGSRCATMNNFSLHADRFVGRQEREKLFDLICYTARGPFSHERLSLRDPGNPSGDLVYSLKTPWRDGTESLIFSRCELLEKLAALIAPKYMHLTRHFGVFASHSRIRPLIILKPGITKGFVTERGDSEEDMKVRLDWARIMIRTFRCDVTVCSACGARIPPSGCVAVNDPASIRRILRYLGMQEHPPPIKPARRIVHDLGFDQTTYADCGS